jgi:hypothetical protein
VRGTTPYAISAPPVTPLTANVVHVAPTVPASVVTCDRTVRVR